MTRALLALALCTAGCSDESEHISLSDSQNYRYSVAVSAEVQSVSSGTDLDVDWSSMTTDLLGDPVDPTSDPTEVSLVHLKLLPEDVRAAISCGTLEQDDVLAFASVVPNGVTTALTSRFDLQGTYVDPASDLLPDPDGSYLVSASHTGANGIPTYFGFALFAPTEGSEGARVSLDGSHASVELSVDLNASTRIDLPGSTPDVVLDWSGLREGSCGAIDLADLDTLQLMSVDESVDEVAADVVHLADRSEDTWTQQTGVAGYGDYDLRTLDPSASGAEFEGFVSGTTWVIALSCSTCLSPAPAFLGVVAVR